MSCVCEKFLFARLTQTHKLTQKYKKMNTDADADADADADIDTHIQAGAHALEMLNKTLHGIFRH